MLTPRDLEELASRGISQERAQSYLDLIARGIRFTRLERPCLVGDGIITLGKEELHRLERVYEKTAQAGRATKFVPASGAASRMFQALLEARENARRGDLRLEEIEAGDAEGLPRLLRQLKRFAFYDDLQAVARRHGTDLDSIVSEKRFVVLLDLMLTSAGLNYANLPKGLIKFHRYPDHCRTPIEEHLVEAAEYTRDGTGRARAHFTVAPEHHEAVKRHVARVAGLYQKQGTRLDIDFSVQKPSTDTLAADLDNRPLREANGDLVFRPGGHGALLENLNDLGGDIVLIKNIDNVLPDRLKPPTFVYKKALGGYLVELQKEVFGYAERLAAGNLDVRFLEQTREFAFERLSVRLPDHVAAGSLVAKNQFFQNRFNRPLRVCGMVPVRGEPGGGPFWVKDRDGVETLQIVEASQVDMNSQEQKRVFLSSTHFNPVDLVCGLRDQPGRCFNLLEFRDPDSGFIAVKSKDGRALKSLELPGLWNGGMAYWNTVFIEVPKETFSPVKTVFDLLRPEHQQGEP